MKHLNDVLNEIHELNDILDRTKKDMSNVIRSYKSHFWKTSTRAGYDSFTFAIYSYQSIDFILCYYKDYIEYTSNGSMHRIKYSDLTEEFLFQYSTLHDTYLCKEVLDLLEITKQKYYEWEK